MDSNDPPESVSYLGFCGVASLTYISPHTSLQLSRMMSSIGFPIPTLIAESRHAVHAAREDVLAVELLNTRGTWLVSLTDCKAVQEAVLRDFWFPLAPRCGSGSRRRIGGCDFLIRGLPLFDEAGVVQQGGKEAAPRQEDEGDGQELDGNDGDSRAGPLRHIALRGPEKVVN
jgi:hypothetical protein